METVIRLCKSATGPFTPTPLSIDMKTFLAIPLIALLTPGFCPGQEPGTASTPMSPEMTAVAANDRAYEAAYAKGDAKALADFFTDDVRYTTEDGRIYQGRPAIENTLKAALAADRDAKLTIDLDSVLVLSPGVVVETGTTTVASKNGREASSQFTAIHVKQDDRWKIRQLVESPLPETSPTQRMAELSWLVGKWEETDKAAGVTIHSNYQWASGGNFITRTVTVKRGDDPVLEGWQIIGWDPVEEGIRSWTFDDAGGYTEGRWTREGQRWLARETGYSADGNRTSSDQTITKADDDRFYWESGNRTLNGDPQPGIGRIEIHRVKGD